MALWKFSFHRETISEDDWLSRCNELGAAGWNMFFMRPVDGWLECYFRLTVEMNGREAAKANFSFHGTNCDCVLCQARRAHELVSKAP